MTELDYYRILYVKAAETGPKPLFSCLDTLTDSPSSLAERAHLCERAIEQKTGFSITALYRSIAGWRRIVTIVIGVVLFLVGLITNYLSADGRINLLFNAIVGYLLWSLCIYLFLIVRRLWMPEINSDHFATLADKANSLFHGFILKIRNRFSAPEKSSNDLIKVLPDFFRSLFSALNGYYRWQMKSLLHLWAICLASGIIAGLYLRGLAVSYQFHWESTFLQSPDLVKTVMYVFCAPAIFIFQIPLPEIANQGVSMQGAVWIHLFAVSLFGYVIVPRAILSLLCGLRSKSLLSGDLLHQDDDYYRDIIFSLHSASENSTLILYGYSIDPNEHPRLADKLENQLGIKISQEQITSMTWGAPAENVQKRQFPLVILLNGIQTPEEDVHGTFLAAMLRNTEQLTVVIDLSNLNPERYLRRRNSWGNFIKAISPKIVYRFIYDDDSVNESGVR